MPLALRALSAQKALSAQLRLPVLPRLPMPGKLELVLIRLCAGAEELAPRTKLDMYPNRQRSAHACFW